MKLQNVKRLFNLQLFTTAGNTTGSVASGNNLSAEMKTYYEDTLIDAAEPSLKHNQFGQKKPIPKNGGKIIEFRKYSSLAKATTALTEGVTPDGNKLNVSTITATVAQYGDWIQLPDMLILTAIDNNMVEATKLLGAQAGQTLDTITREVLNAGTNVMYSPNGTTANTSRSTINNTAVLTVNQVFKAAAILKGNNTKPIGDSFVAIVHPYVSFDLMTSDRWVDITKYQNSTKIYEGEIGKIGNVRFVESTEAKIFASAGATISGTDKYSVYSTLVMGANAYGVTEIEGGGLQHIVKQLGSAGSADPLNQRASVGWKATWVAEILVQEYMIRIESCCSEFSAQVAN